MKYFRQDLLARFASRDDAVALAAQEELEVKSEEYAKHLSAIRKKLPTRFRELQESYYLHDARVMMAWPPDYPVGSGNLPWQIVVNWGAGVSILQTPFVLLTLELDTPPKELLIFNYRNAQITAWAPFELGCERPPYLEWEHDEIDVVERDKSLCVTHTILFSSGFELQIWFTDFDYAVLKPLAQQKEQKLQKRAAQ